MLRAAAAEPCGLAELCQRTGLPRATAHRLAVGLEAHGLLHRGADGRWRPGPALAELAAGGVDPLLDAAAAVLPRLRDITGESVQLYRRDGTHRVCVATAEPASGLRDTVPVGSRLPMTAGLRGQGARRLGRAGRAAGRAGRRRVRRAGAARRAPPRLGAERGRARVRGGQRVRAGARRLRRGGRRGVGVRPGGPDRPPARACAGPPTCWPPPRRCSTGCETRACTRPGAWTTRRRSRPCGLANVTTGGRDAQLGGQAIGDG